MAQRIAVRKKPFGPGAQLIARLTDPSPWILVVQIVLGILLAIQLRPILEVALD